MRRAWGTGPTPQLPEIRRIVGLFASPAPVAVSLGALGSPLAAAARAAARAATAAAVGATAPHVARPGSRLAAAF